MTNFTEGQLVRILPTAFGNSEDAEDAFLRGQVVELIEELGTEKGETMWCAGIPNSSNEVYLVESEFEAVRP